MGMGRGEHSVDEFSPAWRRGAELGQRETAIYNDQSLEIRAYGSNHFHLLLKVAMRN